MGDGTCRFSYAIHLLKLRGRSTVKSPLRKNRIRLFFHWRRSSARPASRKLLRQHDLARPLVVAQAEEDRLAELRLVGPLVERHLSDQLGREPGRSLDARWIGERRRLPDQRLEAPMERGECLLSVAGSHAPHVAQVGSAVRAEKQRSEVGACSCRRRIASDHELFLLVHLDLEPLPRAPLDVDRYAVLGDHPLETLLLCQAECLEAVRPQTARSEKAIGFADRRLEDLSAGPQRLLPQVAPVTVEAIEGGEDDRDLPLLQKLETGDEPPVECDGLAVE